MSWESILYREGEAEMLSDSSRSLKITAEIKDPSFIPLALFPSEIQHPYHCYNRQKHNPEDVKHQALA